MGIISVFGGFAAVQFEPHGDGYVYRANAKGPALPVTAAERDRHIRRAGWSFLAHVVAFGVCMIAAAMVTAHWFPEGDEPGGFVLMGVLIVLIVFGIYRSTHWSMHAPAREFGHRAPVAPARARPKKVSRPTATATSSEPRKGGCLLLLLFGFGELAGGVVAGLATYALLDGMEVSDNIAMIAALVAGFAAAFVIDRWCERRTGASIMDFLATIT